MSKSDSPLADRPTCSECGTLIRTKLATFGTDEPECYSCLSGQTPEDYDPEATNVVGGGS